MPLPRKLLFTSAHIIFALTVSISFQFFSNWFSNLLIFYKSKEIISPFSTAGRKCKEHCYGYIYYYQNSQIPKNWPPHGQQNRIETSLHHAIVFILLFGIRDGVDKNVFSIHLKGWRFFPEIIQRRCSFSWFFPLFLLSYPLGRNIHSPFSFIYQGPKSLTIKTKQNPWTDPVPCKKQLENWEKTNEKHFIYFIFLYGHADH